jgi:hypothetical protein
MGTDDYSATRNDSFDRRASYVGEVPFGTEGCPEVAEVGLAAVLDWLACHRWIHRRSESMSFENASVGSRTLQIAFTVPSDAPTFRVDQRKFCCLPVSLLRKQKVNLFTMTDEEGIERPLLTRETRGQVAAEGLVRLASAMLAKSLDRELPADVESDLRTAAAGKPQEAIEAMRRFKQDAPVVDPFSAACRAFLMGYSAFRLAAWSLALNSMILVRVPHSPGALKSLTASYDEPLYEVRPGSGLRRRARNVVRTVGVSPKKLWFPARVLPAPSSNHYGISAPDGAQVSFANLSVQALGPLSEAEVSSNGGSSADANVQQQIGQFDNWEERDRETGALSEVHLYDRQLPEHSVALIRVSLRPAASGTLRAIWLTSAISLGLLVFAGKHLDTLRSAEIGLTAAQSASALLLLIPTLLAVYIARPGEHTFTSELLFGTRLLGLVAGGTTLLGTCYLVLTDPQRKLGGNWTVLVVVSAAIFLLLTFSSLVNWCMKYPEREERMAGEGWARKRALRWMQIRRRLG